MPPWVLVVSICILIVEHETPPYFTVPSEIWWGDSKHPCSARSDTHRNTVWTKHFPYAESTRPLAKIRAAMAIVRLTRRLCYAQHTRQLLKPVLRVFSGKTWKINHAFNTLIQTLNWPADNLANEIR